MKKHKHEDSQNLLLAVIIAVFIMGCWQYFIEVPRKKLEVQAFHAKESIEKTIEQVREVQTSTAPKTRQEALAGSNRIAIVSDHLHGSLSLTGLRFDDLTLARYHETASPQSPEVVLFTPAYGEEGYFSEFGWIKPAESTLSMPDTHTVWSADSDRLVPGKPVHLSWTNPQGITFGATIEMDSKYMFSVTQSAKDASGKPVALQHYAYINRVFDMKKHSMAGIMHEGPLAVYDGKLKEIPYKDVANGKPQQSTDVTGGGWVGMSDKYWFSAIIPSQPAFSSHVFSYLATDGRERFQADYSTTTPQEESTLRFYAGAKELHELDAYAQQYHIPLLDRAVDFGMFYFLTKPIFLTLTFFHSLVGNFGIAIMLLTVLVKIIMYPMADKSYRSMAQMSLIRPKILELQERHKNDKMKLNQEMIELYKREKVNPASGCLPALIQIPVFFSLYKVLYVTLAMRLAPFFGWIHDLSAPDPTNLFTLFGLTGGTHLLGWAHLEWLHIGAWPLMMAVTMFIQQSMSPPPPDPTQAKVMKFLPVMFLFMFSSVASGLVIYWTWSNLLSILQQWHIKGKYKTTSQRA